MRITFVGAGRMGRPMVERLIQAGHQVCVVDQSAETRAAVVGLGATAAADVEETADDADAVVVCVFSDDQVRAVCLDSGLLDRLGPESVVIVHTTGSPRTVAEIAARSRGAQVVDAAISGGPHNIAAGELTIFLGGSGSAVAKATEVVQAYAEPVLHVGPLGAGQKVKLVNNVLFTAQIGLVAEAIRLAGELGVAEETLLPALANGSSRGAAVAGIAGRKSLAAFNATVGEFLGKDVAAARALAGELGVDLGILDAAIEAGRALGK